MPPFVAAIFGFIRGIPGAALNFIDRRRWWAKEDRAEIEKTYRDEIEVLQEQLNDAESDVEKARIRAEIQRVRDELRSFHRARRELLLSKSLVQRMTPTGAITAEEPPLPQADREVLEAAASVVARLEPPKTFADHFIQGNAFYIAGEIDRALLEYDAALELTPDDPIALGNRGVALDALQRYDEALSAYNRTLELRPDHALNLNNRGIILGNLKRYEDALSDFSQALAVEPGYARAFDNRGVTLTHLGRYEKALADHNRALELDQDLVNALYNRGCVLARMGQLKRSLADLRDAIGKDPKYRPLAREEEDFGNLRSDPTLGPEFERLVGEPED
ncbi:MAG: tetratricopeptide repeat protein [Chloroflexi bacterium]|nr:tetratricopeptide repeat protein [Chloroflexota bacterium]